MNKSLYFRPQNGGPYHLKKAALAKKTIYTLTWYAFKDFQSGNGVGPIIITSLSVLSHVFGAVEKTSSLVFQRTVK